MFIKFSYPVALEFTLEPIKDCRHFQNWNKCGSCTL